MKLTLRYLLILIFILILWNSILVKPLKIFAVFLHELGHAVLAFIFGYGIRSFDIFFNESGLTLVKTRGWFSTFMIANGGYIGSIFFAILILYLKKTIIKKYLLGFIAILMLAVAIKYSGMTFSFTLLYSIIFAGAILIVYMLHNEVIYDWIVDIIGIAAAAYAVYDTFVDTILYSINTKLHIINNWNASGFVSDAEKLAEMTGVPAIIWGISWLVIAMIAVNVILLKTSRSRGNKRSHSKKIKHKG